MKFYSYVLLSYLSIFSSNQKLKASNKRKLSIRGEKLRTEDSQPSRQPMADATETSSTMPASATGLFSQKGPVSSVSPDEISLLLQSPGNEQAKAAQPSDIAPIAEPHRRHTQDPEPIPTQDLAQEKTIDERPADQRSAGQESAAVNSPKPRVDLTGIFRKVQLENLADASSAAKATSAQSGGPDQSSQAMPPDLPAKNTVRDSQIGFTQMFQSLSATAASTNSSQASRQVAPDKTSSGGPLGPATWNETLLSKGEIAEAPYTRHNSPSSPKGNFTSLFQSLGKEAATTPDYEKSNPPSPTPQTKGGFTQLLRTLSAEAEIEARAYPIAPPPPQSQPSSGPGEFTRVISGSMLREAQGRAGAPMEAESPRTPTANQNSASPAPAINIPAPAIPHSPQQLLSPQPTPMQQFPLHASALPAQPAAVPPSPVPQNPTPQNALPRLQTPASKLQQYMPLLLIANLFLMLLVLTLVVVVMLARH